MPNGAAPLCTGKDKHNNQNADGNCELFWISPKTRLYSFSRFQYYAHNLDSLNKKNGMSATPLN